MALSKLEHANHGIGSNGGIGLVAERRLGKEETAMVGDNTDSEQQMQA